MGLQVEILVELVGLELERNNRANRYTSLAVLEGLK